ncbi:MAG: pyridoxamine 5'-phosphate oxidase family protein [Patescibacteria group bacterium]
MKIQKSLKKLIETEPIAIATVMKQGTPNVIGVAFVKVVEEDKLLVTDNFMNQTLDDIKHNSSVAVIVWNKDMEGYKLIGKAEYFHSGKYLDMIKEIPENKDMPCKGALVIHVNKIIKTA